MARKLKNYNWDKNKRGPQPAEYPWDNWTDGSTWETVQGKDFPCKPQTFRVQLSNQAKKMGSGTIGGKPFTWKVRAAVRDNKVIFQFYKKES